MWQMRSRGEKTPRLLKSDRPSGALTEIIKSCCAVAIKRRKPP